MAVGKVLNNKQRKKLKLATGKSKGSTDVKKMDSKNKGHSKSGNSQSGGNQANGASYAGDSKAIKKGNIGKRNSNSTIKGEGCESVIGGNRGFELVNSDCKRKRIYAGQLTCEEKELDDNVGKPSRKLLSKMKQKKLKDDLHEGEGTRKAKPQYFEQSSWKDSLTGRSKCKGSKLLDKKISRTKLKDDHQVKNDEAGVRKSKLKRMAKNKSEATKQLEQNKSRRTAESVDQSPKKKVQRMKNAIDDSQVMDDRPRKKKRVIRIDPHDTSNKRLDDGIAVNNCIKEKEDDSDNSSLELSKNAQFRAIRPSLSILSFVEDNLLGRRREIEFRRAGYNIELSAPLDNIPFSTSPERERIEEAVFRNKLTFFAAAKVSSSFPPPDLPEIAFAGRSNVGKSSLLNALTRQWGVVRTSDKPGLTQTINFFKLGSKLCLVDLPGYGFAYAKEEAKEGWEELVKEYVSTRVGLKRVCLLVDTKWGMKRRDFELIDLMESYQTKYQIVLTKTDLVFPIDVARRAMQIEESLKEKKSAVQPLMMVSSKNGAGIRSLRTVLAKIARFVKP